MNAFILLFALAFLNFTSTSNWAPTGFLNDAYGRGNRRPSRGNRQPSRGNEEPSGGNGQSSSGNGQSTSGNSQPSDDSLAIMAVAGLLQRYLVVLEVAPGPQPSYCVEPGSKIFLLVAEGVKLVGTLEPLDEDEDRPCGDYGYVSVISHDNPVLEAKLDLRGQGPGAINAVVRRINAAEVIGCFIDRGDEDNVGAMLSPGRFRYGSPLSGFVIFHRPQGGKPAKGALAALGNQLPEWLTDRA